MSQLEIFIYILSGTRGATVALLVDQLDTVKDIKSKIQQETNIPAAKQKLLFDGRTLSEDLNCTATDWEIYEQATIFLVVLTIISIRFVTGETFSIDVDLSADTVQTIKRSIEERDGVPIIEQCLVFKGKELTDDLSTLSDCTIEDGSVIPFTIKGVISFQISVKTLPIYSGKDHIKLTVKPTDTIAHVKAMIVAKESIPINKQCLIFNGKHICADDRTLADHRIFDGDILHLLYPINSGLCIFLSGQAKSADIPSCSFKFKKGDQIVLQSVLGGIIMGKVKWTGSVSVPEYSDKLISTVGIETDTKIKHDRDFPELYLNVARSYREEIFKVGLFSSRIFLPEQLVVHADEYKQQTEMLQQMTAEANVFGFSIEEYLTQKVGLTQARSLKMPKMEEVALDKSAPQSNNTLTQPVESLCEASKEHSPISIGVFVTLPVHIVTQACTSEALLLQGKVMWIGKLPDTTEIMAGIELNQSLEGCNDGTWRDHKYFSSPPGRACFVPTSCLLLVKSLNKDFIPNPLHDMTPSREDIYTAVDVKDLTDKFTGKSSGGIQGHIGSSLLDSMIFGLFALNDSFDKFLCKESSDVISKNTVEQLLKGIINPLRRHGLARLESIVDFKDHVKKFCADNHSCISFYDSMGFLKLLFDMILCTKPFLSIKKASGRLEDVYFVKFDIECSELDDSCSTDSLVKNFFTDQKLMLMNIPSTLILVIPQSMENSKRMVIPSLNIDIRTLIERGCSNSISNTQLELVSVVCLEKVNRQYVCYSRSERVWLYHNSMSTTTYDNLFYLPEVTDVSQDLDDWIYNTKTFSADNMPPHVQCFLEDSHVFVYSASNNSCCSHTNTVLDVLDKESVQKLLEEKGKERRYSLSETIATLQRIQSDNEWLNLSFNDLLQSHLQLLDKLEFQQKEASRLANALALAEDEYAKTSQQKDEAFHSLKATYDQKINEMNLVQQRYNSLLHEFQELKANQDQVLLTNDALKSDLCDKKDEILLLEQQYKDLEYEKYSVQSTCLQLKETLTEMENALSVKQDEVKVLKENVRAVNESWKFSHKEVTVTGEILGKGGWGEVVTGIFCEQRVAVKKLHDVIVSDINLELMHREINTMAQLRHPNLLQFIGAIFDHPSGNPMIITEMMDISLREAYETKELTPDPHCRLTIFSIMRNVAVGLNYLHCLPDPIIHRDVSSANILLESKGPGKWKTKISDFGSAKIARSAFTKAAGAYVYSAPESLQSIINIQKKLLTSKMDVFSYGVLLCEVINCQFPCSENFTDLVEQVRSSVSTLAHDLIVKCIEEEPAKRPTMKIVIQNIDKNFN